MVVKIPIDAGGIHFLEKPSSIFTSLSGRPRILDQYHSIGVVMFAGF